MRIVRWTDLSIAPASSPPQSPLPLSRSLGRDPAKQPYQHHSYEVGWYTQPVQGVKTSKGKTRQSSYTNTIPTRWGGLIYLDIPNTQLAQGVKTSKGRTQIWNTNRNLLSPTNDWEISSWTPQLNVANFTKHKHLISLKMYFWKTQFPFSKSRYMPGDSN